MFHNTSQRSTMDNGLMCGAMMFWILCLGLIANPSQSALAEEKTGANSTLVTIDERFRYEFVDQANRIQDAHAKTLRSRIGIMTPRFHFTRLAIEYENVSEVGRGSFNNTLNGNVTRPVVADVKSNEINQLYLEYLGIPSTVVIGGRYRLNLDNQRFIGSVGWRQNDQTYDGATVANTTIPDTKLFYAYIGNINRIFSNASPVGDLASNAHLFHATYSGTKPTTVKGYNYYLDIQDFDAFSSNTFGVSLSGKHSLGLHGLALQYFAEYAHQTDTGNNPVNYAADYYHIAPGISVFGVTITGGYEVLGSDNGQFAFATPLATLHKFNGFADVFLVTPPTGIEDFYVDVTYTVKGLTGPHRFLNGLLLKGRYHDFSSDVGDIDYGEEFDVYAKLPLGRGFYAETKYANYNADQFAVDTEKFIFGFGYKTEFNPFASSN
ncbi:MAG: alginate export family protein [Hyphomicrobiaceae bacterium]